MFLREALGVCLVLYPYSYLSLPKPLPSSDEGKGPTERTTNLWVLFSWAQARREGRPGPECPGGCAGRRRAGGPGPGSEPWLASPPPYRHNAQSVCTLWTRPMPTLFWTRRYSRNQRWSSWLTAFWSSACSITYYSDYKPIMQTFLTLHWLRLSFYSLTVSFCCWFLKFSSRSKCY